MKLKEIETWGTSLAPPVRSATAANYVSIPRKRLFLHIHIEVPAPCPNPIFSEYVIYKYPNILNVIVLPSSQI